MTMGMGIRRNVSQPAKIACLLAGVVATTGCRWIPVRPHEPAPEFPRAATPHAQTTGTPADAAPLPALPVLRSVGDTEAFQSEPTPLLDAAAARDLAMKRVLAASSSPPQIVPVATAEIPDQAPASEPIVAEPSAAPAIVDPAVQTASLVLEPDPVAVPPVENATATAPAVMSLPSPTILTGAVASVWSGNVASVRRIADSVDASMWTRMMAAPATGILPSSPPSSDVATRFQLSTIKICKRVHGFGNTERLVTETLRPGQEVLLYCEIEGLQDEETSAGFHSRLATQISIVGAEDHREILRVDVGEQNDVCARRRRDFFANYRVRIPANVEAGEFEVRVKLTDMLANQESANAIRINVAP